MDAKQFLAEFGCIVNAPGGVQRLREMILSLAVKGELSYRNVRDTAAESTLKKLECRRKEVLKNYTLKATKKHKNLGKPPGDYDLPTGWAWEFLGYITSWPLKDGDWVESKDQDPNGGVRLIQLADIGVDEYRNRSARFLTEEKANELNCYYLQNGDILIARLPDPLGRACIFPGDNKPCVTVVDVAVCRCEPEYINSQYLVICINSKYISSKVELLATGTTRKRVATGKLGSIPIPIPPLEEQKRIVAKVDELMALCDKLEAQQQKRRNLQILTRTTALDALANAQSPHELKDAWWRVQNNLPLLFDCAKDVAELKQTVRELAIIGHLSKRADDGVTNYLCELSKRKKGKRTAKLKEANSEIVLPKGWAWVLLEDLLHSSDAGWSPKCDPTPRENGAWGVLKVSAVTWGTFKSEENKALPLNLEARPEYEVKPFDFMLSRANTADLVAKSVISPVDVPEKLMMSDKIVRLHFLDDDLKPWVNLVNNSNLARAYYKSNATGTSDSMRNVSRKVIHELVVPLPPNVERSKILEKVDFLVSRCDELENQLQNAQALSKIFAQAAISSITGTQIEEEEKMKAPQTELVSKLKLKVSPTNKDQAPLCAILAKHNGELSSKSLWNYSGLEIDAFYQQLKTEMARGWIVEPEKARMIEKDDGGQSEAEVG